MIVVTTARSVSHFGRHCMTLSKDTGADVRGNLTRYLTMLGWSSCLSRASSSSRSATWAATLPATVGSLLISTCSAPPAVSPTSSGSCPGNRLHDIPCMLKTLPLTHLLEHASWPGTDTSSFKGSATVCMHACKQVQTGNAHSVDTVLKSSWLCVQFNLAMRFKTGCLQQGGTH